MFLLINGFLSIGFSIISIYPFCSSALILALVVSVKVSKSTEDTSSLSNKNFNIL